MDIYPTEDMTAAILITGLTTGDIFIYRTPLSSTQPIKFDLLQCNQAHTTPVLAIHIHRTKSLFVSASDGNVKIWNIADPSLPSLIKSIEHPGIVNSAKYSTSGLLLTGCFDGVLRMYGVEPLCSLRWSCKLGGEINSVAWSSRTYMAASYFLRNLCQVRVWNQQDCLFLVNHALPKWLGLENIALLFASDTLLLGTSSYGVYAWNIKAKNKHIQFTLTETPAEGSALTLLNSEMVCASCYDNMLRVYKVHEGEPELFAALPFNMCTTMGSCLYPYNNHGCVLASAVEGEDVRISVTSSFTWLQDVTKITFSNKILPFFEDVHNVIFQYLK